LIKCLQEILFNLAAIKTPIKKAEGSRIIQESNSGHGKADGFATQKQKVDKCH